MYQNKRLLNGRETASRRVYILYTDGLALMAMEGFDFFVSSVLVALVGWYFGILLMVLTLFNFHLYSDSATNSEFYRQSRQLQTPKNSTGFADSAGHILKILHS